MPEDPGIIVPPPATRGAYQVNFNGNDMGLVDMVDPSKSALIFEDITTGTTGKKNVIGKRFVGAKIMVSVAFRQVTVAMQRALCSWANSNNGSSVVFTPPLNADMYTFAKPLILHPTDHTDADTTADLVFDHACIEKLPLVKRDNGSDDVAEVDFYIFPDRTAMQTSTGTITLDQGFIKGT
jgi:hypothetical protein